MSLFIIKYPDRANEENSSLISKWTAINHSVTFEMRRQDFQGAFTFNSTDQTITFFVSAPGFGASEAVAGDVVFMENTRMYGDLTVIQNNGTNLLCSLNVGVFDNLAHTIGFINLYSRENYYAITEVYGVNESNTYDLIGTTKNRPDGRGRFNVDVSSFIKNIVSYEDNFKYNTINQKDGSLGSPFNIKYSENWKGSEGALTALTDVNKRYGVNAAKQIQDLYGQNMGEYVPYFIDNTTPVPLSKFLSDFKEPTYFPGFPFSLSFIYSEGIATLASYRDQQGFDINNVEVFSALGAPLDNSQSEEVNRLMINESIGSDVDSCLVWLQSEGFEKKLKYVSDDYWSDGYTDEEDVNPPTKQPTYTKSFYE